MIKEATEVLVDGFSYTECPRWRDGRLWFSDFYTYQVVAVAADGTARTVADVPEQPSGLGFLPDGDALIVSMRDRQILRLGKTGDMVVHADLSHLAPWHLNDMLVDGEGRAWIGNFGFDLMAGSPMESTCLIRVDADGSAERVADGLYFPNGMVMTPDGKTLIVAESFAQRLTAFDVQSNGGLSNRRTWAELGPLPDTTDVHTFVESAKFVPDGMCMDVEGAIWVADAIGRRAARVAEGGEILDTVSTGTQGVFACMLGGAEGKSLYLSCAPSFAEDERKYTRDAEIRVVEVTVPGAGWP